jgi:hypothetical protein
LFSPVLTACFPSPGFSRPVFPALFSLGMFSQPCYL